MFVFAYPTFAPTTYFGPAISGIAVVSWGVGILMIFLALAARRVREAAPTRKARTRPAAGRSATEPARARESPRRIPLEAHLLVLTGTCFFVGVLVFALPSFLPYYYFTETLAAFGVALVLWGIGIMFLFLSLAARSIRES